MLVTGLYLTIVAWGPAGWILVSLGRLVVVAVIGGVLTGIPMARIEAGVGEGSGPLPQELRQGLRATVLVVSITTRIAIMLGIVFLMVLKSTLPVSLLVIGLATVIGVGAGMALGAREPLEVTS